jgi:hypothetical protein
MKKSEIFCIFSKLIIILHQQYTPRDRFLVIRKTASQGVSFAFYKFRLQIQTRCIPIF